jgi:hypothetical protein
VDGDGSEWGLFRNCAGLSTAATGGCRRLLLFEPLRAERDLVQSLDDAVGVPGFD